MRAGIERELARRADQRVLRWFGYVERMDEYRMARRVLMAEVSEETEVGLDGWCEGGVGQQRNDGGGFAKEWRALVHMLLNQFHAAIFAWPCVPSDRPPVLWWLSPGKG